MATIRSRNYFEVTCFANTFEKIASTHTSLPNSQQQLADSQESLAVTKRADNIVKAAEGLAETDILYEEAIANLDKTCVCI